MHKATIVSCLILISLSCCMSYYHQDSAPVVSGRSVGIYQHGGKPKICRTKVPDAFKSSGCKIDKNCYVKCPGRKNGCKRTLPKRMKKTGCKITKSCKVACFQHKGKSGKCHPHIMKKLNIKGCRLDKHCALDCHTHKRKRCPGKIPKKFKGYRCSFVQKCHILCKMNHRKVFEFEDEEESYDYQMSTEHVVTSESKI